MRFKIYIDDSEEDFDDFSNEFNRMNNLFNDIIKEFFDHHDQGLINDSDRDAFDESEEEIEFQDDEYQDDFIKPKVYFVPSNRLPRTRFRKTLGLYIPHYHIILISNNLPPKVEKFVYFHELAHSMGIMDEKQADRFAEKKCGYRLKR